MMRLLVTGSLKWTDWLTIIRHLRDMAPSVLIHCARRGADLIAESIASDLCISVDRYPVDPALDGPWPGAGPRRYARMLRDGKPTQCLAFDDLWRVMAGKSPLDRASYRKTVTGDMVKLMLRAGLPVRWVATPGATAVNLTAFPAPPEGR